MTPTLVFVHGRGQQGREPDGLRRRWAAGLNKGLTAAGRAPMDPAAVEAIGFPFYGDVLWAEVVQSRAAVQEVVRPALLADPGCVLVGHSLGGVVSAELLGDDEVRERTSLFVAVGAPLGLDAVTAGLRPPGAARPTAPWVNVYDPRDWVTLGSPLPREGGLQDQLAVANPRSHEHSIEHYLAHPEVAALVVAA